MDNDSSWFSRYWELSPDERREFIDYAMTEPELADEASQLVFFEKALLASTELSRNPLSDDALLFYAQRNQLDIQSPVISRTLNIIEGALQGNPEAFRRLAVLEDRLRFFDDNIPTLPVAMDGLEGLPGALSEPPHKYRASRSSVRRMAIAVTRQMAATVLLFAMIYAGLFAASTVTTPTEIRSAYLASDDAAIELLLSHQRGDPVMDESVASLLDGANMLRQAQVSTLGLFRRYDPVALSTADRALGAVFETNNPGNMDQLIAYFKAKLALAHGQISIARSVLSEVDTDSNGDLDEAIEALKKSMGSS
ncbi:MAG: hypothetical protein HKN43_11085 [Rhodothermales bacterium]|nr:hypothetical protein [Rhodothermales bacterium]